MRVLETSRLTLRHLCPADAVFVRQLLNEPSFIRYIGDRGVRTDEDARRYILQGPMASYERNGFGLYLVEVNEQGTPAGICGLLKRDSLEDVDLGFAFLPHFWRRGYAFEAASAVLADAAQRGLTRVLAITSPDNVASIALLGKLGFEFNRMMRQGEEGTEINVFVRTAREETYR